jgi:hypothetical protein
LLILHGSIGRAGFSEVPAPVRSRRPSGRRTGIGGLKPADYEVAFRRAWTHRSKRSAFSGNLRFMP